MLALSAQNEIETGHIDEAWLEAMSHEWFAASVVEPHAYLLTFAPGARYASPNFLWFRERFRDFVYVDRIVVAASARGQGLARRLYEDLFAAARVSGARIDCLRSERRAAEPRVGRVPPAPQLHGGGHGHAGQWQERALSDAQSGRLAMKPGARAAAAIEILVELEGRRRPAADAVREWMQTHRFAGSKDRAEIGDLVFGALRWRQSSAWRFGEDHPRAWVWGALRWGFGQSAEWIEQSCYDDPHAPPPPTEAERAALAGATLDGAPAHVRGDYPRMAGRKLRARVRRCAR